MNETRGECVVEQKEPPSTEPLGAPQLKGKLQKRKLLRRNWLKKAWLERQVGNQEDVLLGSQGKNIS